VKQIKAGIINVSGYIGAELARLLLRHPRVELTSVTGRSTAGKKLGDIFPSFSDVNLSISTEIDPGIDIAFSAMPHAASLDMVPYLLDKGIRVIDVSADFRLKNIGEYQSWYGVSHTSPDLVEEAVYGLPELHKPDISTARLIANPGCYATSIILALAPAMDKGFLCGDIIADSKSGVSGAGRALSQKTHYPETNEDTSAYSLQGHRHLPEIEQELKGLDPEIPLSLTFVPHMVPMTRGIMSSCYATVKSGVLGESEQAEKEIRQIYREFYKESPFVRIVDTPPHTKHTWGSNFCLIHPVIDRRTGRLIIISCLDNLVKGGAGQAVQNMNLMFGFPETNGLETLAIYP